MAVDASASPLVGDRHQRRDRRGTHRPLKGGIVMSGWQRFGAILIAVALLLIALRFHKAKGRNATKIIGVVLAFLSGCAFLGTIVGGWMVDLSEKIVGLSVAGLIVCVGIIVVDCAIDRKPDKPAFWAAALLPIFIVIGGAQIPTVTGQVGDGAGEVGTQIRQINDDMGGQR
jgi:MFS family permease